MKVYTDKPFIHALIAFVIAAAITVATAQTQAQTQTVSYDSEDIPAESRPVADSEPMETAALSEANAAADAGDYEHAINIVRNALSDAGNDEELLALLKKLTEEYKAQIDDLSEESYVLEGYPAVVKLVEKGNAVLGNEADLSDVLEKYIARYREDTLAAAESVMQSNGYEAALDIVRNGLALLPNDAMFLSAIDEYNEYRPIPISEVYRITSRTFSTEDSVTDIYGQEHHGPCYFGEMNGGFGKTSRKERYFTEGKYGKLSGTIIVPSSQYGGTSRVVYVEVYGDDILLYTSPAINGKLPPTDFEVDIRGVAELEISIGCEYDIGHVRFEPRICDLVVQKT